MFSIGKPRTLVQRITGGFVPLISATTLTSVMSTVMGVPITITLAALMGCASDSVKEELISQARQSKN